MVAKRSLSPSRSWHGSADMSLLQIRRERKEGAGGPNRPPRLWKLLIGLAVVLYLIWYLGQRT